MEWINCNDRLPSYGRRVLAFFQDWGRPRVAEAVRVKTDHQGEHWEIGSTSGLDLKKTHNASHWMPLPGPPENTSDEGAA